MYALMLKFKDWKPWFAFRGRAGRREYWFVVLLALAMGWLADAVGAMLGSEGPNLAMGLFIAVAQTAVVTRRLHDLGQSGWWQLPPSLLACLAAAYFGFSGDSAAVGPAVAGLMLVLLYLIFLVAVGLLPGRPEVRRYEA